MVTVRNILNAIFLVGKYFGNVIIFLPKKLYETWTKEEPSTRNWASRYRGMDVKEGKEKRIVLRKK